METLSLCRHHGTFAGAKIRNRHCAVFGREQPPGRPARQKLGISDVYKDCKDKASALRDFSERHGLSLQEICFIGDDVNDLAALSIVGLSACPADARPSIRETCQLVTKHAGGNGAVREIVDMLLAAARLAAKNRLRRRA